MHLLDPRRVIGANQQPVIGVNGRTTAITRTEQHRGRPSFPGRGETRHDIGGAATRREGDDDVAWTGEGRDLSRKDMLKVEVVADTRHDGRIRRQ